LRGLIPLVSLGLSLGPLNVQLPHYGSQIMDVILPF
jgi:hypothetical protein